MAMTFNQAQIIGHLGQDPDIRTFDNGGMIANLSIATSERWKDKRTGEVRERTEWHRVAVKADGLARMVGDYCRKGSAVFIQGRLETRKWQDQSGQDRYTTEIVVTGFGGVVRLLDSRDRTGEVHRRSGAERGGGAGQGGGYGGGAGGGHDIDDEIPF